MDARVGAALVALVASLPGCERGSEPRWWDDRPAPPPARELRVLAPSGRLAPSAWRGRVLYDGREQSTSSADRFLALAVPEGVARAQVVVPGCAPLDLPLEPGRTIARLVAGPVVPLRIVLPPSFDPVEKRLHVSLVAQGERNSSRVASLARSVVDQHAGFTTAGAPVPRDGLVDLRVSTPGSHYLTWTVERAGGRSSYSDSRGQAVEVPPDGSVEPIDAPLPEYVQKALLR